MGRLKGRYVVSWRDGDARRRFRLRAETRADADREAIDVYRREMLAHQATAATIRDLWDAYCEEKDGKPVVTTMGFEAKAMMPELGHLRPDQIDRGHIAAYTAKRRGQGRKDGTIRTELGHLTTVLRWAVQQKIIDHAPKIDRPSLPAPKDRWITKAEARALLGAATAPHIRLAIRLMLATAGRVGAILDLTWNRVDFQRREIDLRVDTTGPRKGRARVPMNSGVEKALKEAQKMALTEFVIEWNGKPCASIKTGFRAAAKSAGLSDVTPHVLRHSAAVWMVSEGVSMEKVAQFLGHSNVSVTFSTYARFAPDHLRDEADILDF
uniref:tyrosine-type recombinase/integrase n=1 Tax=Stappia indica TaxID=538381 RepID=UPI00384B8331